MDDLTSPKAKQYEVNPLYYSERIQEGKSVWQVNKVQPGAVPSWMPWGQPEKEDWTSQPRPHSWTQSQMSAHTGNFKMGLHLASLLESWPTSLWCYAFIALPHTRLPQSEIIFKNSSKIALIVHCKCSTVRYKAHRVHLPPWIKKRSSVPSPGFLWHAATISWPILFSLLATALDFFKSRFCFPLFF